jgi:hypothetical protein
MSAFRECLPAAARPAGLIAAPLPRGLVGILFVPPPQDGSRPETTCAKCLFHRMPREAVFTGSRIKIRR